jgi:8-oxo-dGTP pyrophosphatase MutT (NUDIX family)
MNEHHNTWKVIDEREVYNNNWITVTHYNVINPSGGIGVYGKVHMKNIAIGIVPLDEEMNTYLVGQYRFPLNEYSWEIPEGGGPLDHDPLLSAQRELLEETGLKATYWDKILEMKLSNSVTDERCIIYLARNLSQYAAMLEETEDITVRKISFDDVYAMVQNGKITDVITITAVLKIKLLMLEGKLKT